MARLNELDMKVQFFVEEAGLVGVLQNSLYVKVGDVE